MLSRRILTLLLEKAQDAQQTAIRELGRLHALEKAESVKQDLLKDFHEEVIEVAMAQQRELSTSAQLQTPSMLLDKVELALLAQKASVERARHIRNSAELEVRESRNKLKRLEVLQARADKAQSMATRRLEQKLNDEFSTRSKYARR
jgi:flagellar biosynthesis chaperone FliJ